VTFHLRTLYGIAASENELCHQGQQGRRKETHEYPRYRREHDVRSLKAAVLHAVNSNRESVPSGGTHKVGELEHCALQLVDPKHLLKMRIQDVQQLPGRDNDNVKRRIKKKKPRRDDKAKAGRY
jgi:hypothetical protein